MLCPMSITMLLMMNAFLFRSMSLLYTWLSSLYKETSS